jgi:hypothetical protein
MKILFVAALPAVLAVCCLAQAPSAAPGLILVGQKWHTEFRNPALDRDWDKEANDSIAEKERIRDHERMNDRLRAKGMQPNPPLQPPVKRLPPKKDRSMTYFYEVTVRNEDGKDVASVTWEYIFDDLDTGREVGRRRFESRESIGVRKTKDLVGKSSIPPTGTVNAKSKNNPDRYSEKVEIVRVEYADGTTWSAASK